MRVDAFDFDLPADRIALRPAVPRDAARLLDIDPDRDPPLHDHVMRELPDLLRPGDLLVLNDTKVIPAQLEGRRIRGDSSVKVACTLHMREGADMWRAFARPARKLQPGDRLVIFLLPEALRKVEELLTVSLEYF